MEKQELLIHTRFVIDGLSFNSLSKMKEIEEKIQTELSYFVKERKPLSYTTIDCNYTIERISQTELFRALTEDSIHSSLIRDLHLRKTDIYMNSTRLKDEKDPFVHFSNFTVKLKINECQESGDNIYHKVIMKIIDSIDAYIKFNRIMLHKNYKVNCINYKLNAVDREKISFSRTGTFPIVDYSIMSSEFKCSDLEETTDSDMLKYIHFLNSISDDSIGFVRLTQATYNFSDMLLNITLIITTFVNLISVFERKIEKNVGFSTKYQLYYKQKMKKFKEDRSKVTTMVELHCENDAFPNSDKAVKNIEFAYKLRNTFAHGSNRNINKIIAGYKKSEERFKDVSDDYILDYILLHISRNLIYMFSWLNTELNTLNT